MIVYTCTDHDYHWPVGVASIVVAPNEEEARKLLDAELVEGGLRPYEDKSYTLIPLSVMTAQAVILLDGNY